MRDLAPEITRQRLLIEGLYNIDVSEEEIKKYFSDIVPILKLRAYGQPIIHSPEGLGKEGNDGFDAFLPLIDSGISLYVWSNKKFLAIVIFTCKEFDSKSAVDYTCKYFNITEVESKEF